MEVPQDQGGQRVIDLRDPRASDARTVGAKAASLHRLITMGFDVPSGFCLTASAFAARSESGSLDESLEREIEAACSAVPGPWAVRSSSVDEDQPDASYAGQYLTILGVSNVPGVIAAIRSCWESAQSSNVQAYQGSRDRAAAAPMCVLVQQMVDATSAGVLFSLHPVTERTDQVVVNANFGIGDSVVSGSIEPDTFVVEKATGARVEAVIGSKAKATRLVEGGVALQGLESDLRGRPSLSGPQLARLAEAARRLEEHHDHPIDAEFAFVGDALFLLQARPITAGSEAYYLGFLDDWTKPRGIDLDQDTVWVRGSPLSSLPVSPLYYSEMAPFFWDMYAELARIRGTQAPGRLHRYFRGYTYTRADLADGSSGNSIEPLSPFSGQWMRNVVLSLRHPKDYAFWCNLRSYYRLWQNEWWPEIEQSRPRYEHATANDVVAFIEVIEAQRRRRSVHAAIGVAYASDFLGLLSFLMKRWLPEAGPEVVGALTGGLPNSFTHDENVALWRLGQIAARSESLRQAVLAKDPEAIGRCAGGGEFLAAVEDFRRQHPHRGCSDRDLIKPRWGDSQQLLLRHLASIVALGSQDSPEAAHARAEERRQEAERWVCERLRNAPFGWLRSRLFRRVLRATQQYWIQRDNQRHTFDRYFWELRCAYRALGRMLAEQGGLGTADDVFFCAKSELYAAIDGSLPLDRLRRRAEWRRHWWSRLTDADAPVRLRGNAPAAEGDAHLDPDARWGVGGSPGRASGPVRWISSLDELGQIRKGDILVTDAIDPAWTPVFGIIAGVISIEGGLLSHATILGREYGIPVVIGAARARALETGDLVTIDGSTGAVTLDGDEERVGVELERVPE